MERFVIIVNGWKLTSYDQLTVLGDFDVNEDQQIRSRSSQRRWAEGVQFY